MPCVARLQPRLWNLCKVWQTKYYGTLRLHSNSWMHFGRLCTQLNLTLDCWWPLGFVNYCFQLVLTNGLSADPYNRSNPKEKPWSLPEWDFLEILLSQEILLATYESRAMCSYSATHGTASIFLPRMPFYSLELKLAFPQKTKQTKWEERRKSSPQTTSLS